MATIEDINKSISEMSDEELKENIKNIRAGRRVAPPAKKKTAIISTDAILGDLTPEAAEAMLKEIMG